MAPSALWVLMAKLASSQFSDETPLLQRITDADPTEENENLLQVLQSSGATDPAEEKESPTYQAVKSWGQFKDHLPKVVQSTGEVDLKNFAGTYKVVRNGQPSEHKCTITCDGGFDLADVVSGNLQKDGLKDECNNVRDKLAITYVKDLSRGVLECVMQTESGLFGTIYSGQTFDTFDGLVEYERESTTDCSKDAKKFADYAGTYIVKQRAGKKGLGEATIGCDGGFESPLSSSESLQGTLEVSEDEVKTMCSFFSKYTKAVVQDLEHGLHECLMRDGKKDFKAVIYDTDGNPWKKFKGIVEYKLKQKMDCSAPGN